MRSTPARGPLGRIATGALAAALVLGVGATALPALTAAPSASAAADDASAPKPVPDANARVSAVPGTDAAKAGSIAGVETQLLGGLYQTAYSPRHGSIYVTSSIGRPGPDFGGSAIMKLNADTLKLEAYINPAIDDTYTGRDGKTVPNMPYAAYGVDVDDAHNTVWITQTRQNTIAVYNADTLELVKQFDKGIVSHSRDVRIDAARGRAYVNAARSNTVHVFDTTTLAQLDDIVLAPTPEEFASMGLELDSEGGVLYVGSTSTNKVARVDLAASAVDFIPLPDNVQQATGVARDPGTGRLYVVDQGSGTLTVLTKDGQVLSNAATPPPAPEDGKQRSSGALYTAFDSVNGLLYVANRNSGTITVHDADGALVQTLDSGPMPNEVRADGRGNVYAVTKGGARDGSSKLDYIQKYHVVAAEPDPEGRWIQDSVGWWYRHADGTFTADGTEVIDGSTYRFDAAGYMVTGWARADGKWFYYAPSGAQASGWAFVDRVWYYLDPATGAMATGWLQLDGSWYYLEASGAMAMGWAQVDGAWYYLRGSGAMATGWYRINAVWYHFADGGQMMIGWINDGGTWYFLHPSGAMATGWLNLGGDWYYFLPSGAMATGSHWVNGVPRTFDDSGVWVH